MLASFRSPEAGAAVQEMLTKTCTFFLVIHHRTLSQCVKGQMLISNCMLILEGAHWDQLYTLQKLDCVLQPPLCFTIRKFITVIHEIQFKIMASPAVRGRKVGVVVEFKGKTSLKVLNYPYEVLFKYASLFKVIQRRIYRLSLTEE